MDNVSVQKQPRKAMVIAAFAAIYIVWGSTYIAILIAVKEIPPFFLVGIRFLTAGALLYIFCRSRGESLPDRVSIRKLSISGMIMLFLGTGAVAWVEQFIDSGLAAIIVATTPLWFVLLDKSKWKYNFSNKWIIVGLIIGFVGVLTLFADGKAFSFSGDEGNIKLISFFVLLAGTICWAIGSLYLKYQHTDGSSGMKSAVQMIAAGLASVIAGFALGEYQHFNLASISLDAIVAMVYLILVGSLVGYMAYVWLLSVRPPSIVGTYAYVNPVVAVYLGWLILDEPLTTQRIIALLVILSGVVLVTLSKKKAES